MIATCGNHSLLHRGFQACLRQIARIYSRTYPILENSPAAQGTADCLLPGVDYGTHSRHQDLSDITSQYAYTSPQGETIITVSACSLPTRVLHTAVRRATGIRISAKNKMRRNNKRSKTLDAARVVVHLAQHARSYQQAEHIPECFSDLTPCYEQKGRPSRGSDPSVWGRSESSVCTAAAVATGVRTEFERCTQDDSR